MHENFDATLASRQLEQIPVHKTFRLELEELLKSNGISAVLVCGLAFDICVRHTVIDANNLGFLSGVVRDCRWLG